MNPDRTLIVVPAFNEAQTVAVVLSEIRRAMPAATSLVVDDGSSDDTSAVAAQAGSAVLTLPFNLGVGGAMRAGFRYAVLNDFHAVVQVDADGQHDPQKVATLLAGLDNADIVIGARFAGEGEYHASGPRRWAMIVLASVIGRVGHVHLTDATSGFKAMGPRAIALFARQYPAEYLGDTVEALVIAAKAGLRIAQVPVPMRQRLGGEPSHGPFKSTVYLARACLALVFALIHPRVTSLEASRQPDSTEPR